MGLAVLNGQLVQQLLFWLLLKDQYRESFNHQRGDTMVYVRPLEAYIVRLGIIVQVDNEDLVATLETVVEKFGEEMAPYATTLCQHLTDKFWRLKVGLKLSNRCMACYLLTIKAEYTSPASQVECAAPPAGNHVHQSL